jgi:hypothetical protein
MRRRSKAHLNQRLSRLIFGKRRSLRLVKAGAVPTHPHPLPRGCPSCPRPIWPFCAAHYSAVLAPPAWSKNRRRLADVDEVVIALRPEDERGWEILNELPQRIEMQSVEETPAGNPALPPCGRTPGPRQPRP